MIRVMETASYVFREPLCLTGLVVLLVLVLLIVAGPFLVPNDPTEVNMAERLQGPSPTYPLGTDHLGRCIFSRLIEGGKITLGVSFLALLTVLLIGVPLGLWSGYRGGWVDNVLMRVVDSFIAFPDFIVAIAIAGFLGPSLFNLMAAMIMVKWMSYARLVRGIVLAEKEKEYILAARVSGSRERTILYKHLWPRVLSPVLVMATLDMGKMILLISSLSYIGLGAQPPLPEWGAMLNDGRAYFQTMPSLMIYPGLAILLVVLSFNLIGDGLRDILDVKRI
ncbi:peptide/nickel transport system permease protein [Caldalkalibacillus uzonensis]|uniref:Peptide/nickel transport system permease protein n=1 Tax=Caldalkalibacillus uzonensis TaxID=353224 RepID=A0ABU0CRK7_9BACI|nr:nickel transporter permease [Caldalkalibacillus uzonensis]MDQ0339053.1 peptide/nickel transport system permease protein [Caldalkalibacillus uzonensis]